MSGTTTLRIGSHPMNFSLFILRHRGVLESLAQAQGWHVQWLDYAEGRHSGDYLTRGEVDWVGTGSTPPLYSQADGVALVYVGASASRPTGSALLVQADSPLQSIAQLQGKRIASTVGSYTDHFLAKALHHHTLNYHAVEVIDLPGSAGGHALHAGDVDAWAALEPLLSQQLASGTVRVLGEVGDYIPNRSLFWARRSWIEQNYQHAQTVYAALADNDRWIAENIEDAALILAAAHPAGIDAPGWVQSLSQRPWGIEPATADIAEEQQVQARLLFDVGLLAAPLEAVHVIDLSATGVRA